MTFAPMMAPLLCGSPKDTSTALQVLLKNAGEALSERLVHDPLLLVTLAEMVDA